MVSKSQNNTSTKKQKTIFSRVKKLPVKPVPGATYIVEGDNPDFVDMYTVDNNGNIRAIINNLRCQGSPTESELSLIDYKSDISTTSNEYYYGYEYEDNTFKIISVEKGNVVNQLKAVNMTGTFTTNWNNRQTLTYN